LHDKSANCLKDLPTATMLMSIRKSPDFGLSTCVTCEVGNWEWINWDGLNSSVDASGLVSSDGKIVVGTERSN